MKKYRIQNGRVYTEQCRFEEKSLCFVGERIVDQTAYSAADGEEVLIDASGCYVIPGLTDIHFHGCVGSDCCDGTREAFRTITEYEGRNGITTITPATMTVSEEQLMRVAKAAASFHSDSGAVLAGLYMEGPFISAAKKGAQNEKFIRRPDAELFQRLQEAANGGFRTVALAPETEGAIDFIRTFAGKVTLSLAHMTADYETVCEALEAGASQITHLYNAMPGFSHRAPGPVGAAADDPHCMAELICDGIHIHPAVVRTTFRMFGDDRIIMISDSLRAAGMPDGEYELGGQQFYVKGNRATLADGTIAGSATNLMDCLRIAVKDMRIPLESTVRAAAVNPARAIGIYGEYGSLAPGKYANVVLLDENLALRGVYIHGRTENIL
ncbi:MAG: N-acetylglucosamine-6-phosphate deacetylase [Lachnospiraceae bacterium]|nr:N-acetylglucosamine-6-phosphate deacetylase [Lachnospiraceae bacterium]